MEIRKNKVSPCRAQKNKAKIFSLLFYYLVFVSIFGKNKYFEKPHSFTHVIKGTVLGRVL